MSKKYELVVKKKKEKMEDIIYYSTMSHIIIQSTPKKIGELITDLSKRMSIMEKHLGHTYNTDVLKRES
jgi:hypothetical protein